MKYLVAISFLAAALIFLPWVVLGQTTAIPDPAFEQALITLGLDTGSIDGVVLTASIDTVTSLDVINEGIDDLRGIEDFIALETLLCSYNSIDSLNFTQNLALSYLLCYNNTLSSLNVMQNTALTYLSCFNNNLFWLNVTQNTALTYLGCNENNLWSLDVTQNTALTDLYCDENNLTSLDITQNTALVRLECYSNSLTGLDVTQNTALEKLWCVDNQIGGLEISNCIALTELYCYSNKLTSLDASQNTNLTRLQCELNPLTCLNVRNGNNSNFTSFNALINPNLSCIEVDDVAWADANWTQVDGGTSFSEDCNYPVPCGTTLIPDTVFEQALINQGYDNIMDGKVLTANVASITFLNLNGSLITDLTGIQDFASVDQLQVFKTQLTYLDVSSNSQLSVLDCGLSQLDSLNLGNNTNLTELWCDSNYLTNLDVSQNTGLTRLVCGINQITSLDISTNPNLNDLWCWQNQLTCLHMGGSQPWSLIATDNPNLTCIEVNDTAWANANWTVAGGDIDSIASFSIDCGSPCVPAVGIEYLSGGDKHLVYITDILGRRTLPKPNVFLIYQYSDGSVEKRIMLD